MDDYETRAKSYDFASLDEIKTALQDGGTILLDLRSPPEIERSGKIEGSINTACTPDDCEGLRMNPEQFVPNKESKVVLYCGSGRREYLSNPLNLFFQFSQPNLHAGATKARDILREKGHSGPILNAGGYADILRITGK